MWFIKSYNKYKMDIGDVSTTNNIQPCTAKSSILKSYINMLKIFNDLIHSYITTI